MYLARSKSRTVDQVPVDEYIDYFNNQIKMRYNDYIKTEETWTKCFPKENFKITFFDDLVLHPERLMADIFNFLNINNSDIYLSEKLKQKVHDGKSGKMPPEIEQYLANQYYEKIKAMSEKWGKYTFDWLEYAETIRSREIA